MNESEKDMIQVKVPIQLLLNIREANTDYRLVPAKDIAIIALNHFLFEIKRRKKAT